MFSSEYSCSAWRVCAARRSLHFVTVARADRARKRRYGVEGVKSNRTEGGEIESNGGSRSPSRAATRCGVFAQKKRRDRLAAAATMTRARRSVGRAAVEPRAAVEIRRNHTRAVVVVPGGA